MVAAHTASGQRREVIWRIVAALVPAFVLCNTLGVAIVLLLPIEQVDAISWVAALIFLFYTGLVMWIFHEASLRRIWISLFVTILASSALSFGLLKLEGML